MCGINGIVYFSKTNKALLNKKIDRMAELTKHRGPDASAKILFDSAALNENRLAIIAPEDKQVIKHQMNRLYALFNGEIVNFKTLKGEIRSKSEHESDGSLILPLYMKLGPLFIKKLAGMFAIAIYDEKKNQLYLYRDPLGIKPLYYAQTKDCVIFSSELKSVYAALDEKPSIDFAAFDHILRIRFHPGDSTVFPSIKRVLPGQLILFEKNKVHKEFYWKAEDFIPDANTPNPKSKEHVTEEFRGLFNEVLKEYSYTDVPGGFFVSGGLDSSLVTSMVSRFPSSFHSSLSLTFQPEVKDEKYGSMLEKYLKTKFTWISLTSKIARDTLEKLVYYLDEPLENPIHVGTYLMAERARQIGLKCVLTGDGSDEFFLGYERHAPWFDPAIRNKTDEWLKWLWTLVPSDVQDLYTLDALSMMSPLVDFNNKKISNFTSFSDAILFEQKDRMPEYHCMRLDRMTMAHGIEARVPFLDHRIVEFVQKLPFSFRYGKIAKDWLKEIARPYLPKEIIERPKTHFPSLPNIWLQNEGDSWARGILLNPQAKIRGYFRQDTIEKYLDEHKQNKKLRGKLLWALITIELWLHNTWL